MPIGLEHDIVDQATYQQTVERFRESSIRLPKISELADPGTISKSLLSDLSDIDPDAPDPHNLFRVHWHNDASRKGNRDN